jgi:two-component system, LytTR family, sensor kinase
MKLSIDRTRFKIFLWIGLAYLVPWVLTDLVENTDTFFQRVWNNIWLVAYLTTLNYYFYERLVPTIKFTWGQIFFRAPLLIFGFLMLYSFGMYAWRSIGIGLGLYFELTVHESALKGVGYHFPYAAMSILFFGVIRHIYDYRKLKEVTQQLRIEKQEAELNYLKSQTNPHFLFNTLNNIYALTRDKSDLAPESVLRLSKILRFMLYETGGEYVAIEQEVKILADYIALEKLRYDDSLRVNFNQDLEDPKQSIPPLLLIPLVENAFKHGVSETRSEPFVDIHLRVKNKHLVFVVKNSSEQSPNPGIDNEGIGLANLRRQLQLLYTDYGLSTVQEKSSFTATLNINLASHV